MVSGSGFSPDSQVLLDGIPLSTSPVSTSRLTAVLPDTIPMDGARKMTVSSGGGISTALLLPSSQASPGIYSVDGSGTGQGFILNADGTLNLSGQSGRDRFRHHHSGQWSGAGYNDEWIRRNLSSRRCVSGRLLCKRDRCHRASNTWYARPGLPDLRLHTYACYDSGGEPRLEKLHVPAPDSRHDIYRRGEQPGRAPGIGQIAIASVRRRRPPAAYSPNARRYEPYLRLIRADHLADEQVIGAVVTAVGGLFGEGARFCEGTISWASSRREFITGASSRPFGGRGTFVSSATSAPIATLTPPKACILSATASTRSYLLAIMLIKEKMQLVEGWASHLPMTFFVQIAE